MKVSISIKESIFIKTAGKRKAKKSAGRCLALLVILEDNPGSSGVKGNCFAMLLDTQLTFGKTSSVVVNVIEI